VTAGVNGRKHPDLYRRNFSPPGPTPQSPQALQRSDTLERDESGAGIAYERPSDLAGYNRVQGLSLGVGYRVPLPWSDAASLVATIRYGVSDDRLTGRLSMTHGIGRARVVVSGYDDIADIDPLAAGRTVSNSVNALFAAHDNGDYLLSEGGGARLETTLGAALDLAVEGRVERQRSVRQVAESEINDFFGGSGRFPPNPPVEEGTYGLLSVNLKRARGLHWQITMDLLGGGGRATPRVFGTSRRSFGRHRLLTLQLKAGIEARPAPPQSRFRLGGLSTIRGFEYGVVQSHSFWALQMDLAPLPGRTRPVLFLDTGQGAELPDRFSGMALIGGGVGLCMFSGLVRLDFSHPISPDIGGKVRFDIVVQGIR
jgi:hypothetical protein